MAVSVAPDLPTPLPPVDAHELEALTQFRKGPPDDSAFRRLRRQLRESENWRGLATLLVVYAAGVSKRAPADRVAEMYLQATELWVDRVGDKAQAAHTLARVFKVNPGNRETYLRLKTLYGEAGLSSPHATLLRWAIEQQKDQPETVVGLLVELGQVGEHGFMNVPGALTLYRKALALDPRSRTASANLIRLHIQAGAWLQACDLLNAEIARLDPASDAERVCDLLLQLARIEHEQMDNVAAAARYLQRALKTKSDSVAALRAFGILYQGSDKASEDGLAKAADIFLKAASLAHQQGDAREALKLVRRSLSLRPDHREAGQLLADLLIAQKRWLDLDDLYRSWLEYVSDDAAYELWFQRGDLLETKLSRREEARMCFETASQYESLDGPAWQRLERLYSEL
ncbi:MAG: tetratricopeptide repeat protein, partial [Nannocystaceae bacterium]